MVSLKALDMVILAALLVGIVAYFTRRTYWAISQDPYASSVPAMKDAVKSGKTRDIIEKMNGTGKSCVIFYGSQTGTAEDYASRLAKEDYDYDNLDELPDDKVAFFVLATHGEGEPTDNAVQCFQFLAGDDVTFKSGATIGDQPLSSLKYVAFGLGNNTYEHYNATVRRMDAALTKLGAKRIGSLGEGDDGAGTMEEDFLAWKETMWATLADAMGLQERESLYEPVFCVTDDDEKSTVDECVYLGEPTAAHREGRAKGPYSSQNPYIAPIVESHELFTVKDRNCLHIEISIAGSNLSYQTGDHIAVWPTNAGAEVDRFLRVFGLEEQRHSVINITSIDTTVEVPIPTPTTYDAAVRYYMEVCAPVSRQFMSILASWAPDEPSKDEIVRLGNDKDYFHEKITKQCFNIAQALQSITSKTFSSVPFALLIEGVNKLQPRYYSISSSALVRKDMISITAVVEAIRLPGASHIVKGYDSIYVPVHVRASNFNLPSDPSKPIIMVGPGTGVAPFRGFIQERAALAAKGEKVGTMLLFFGCRRRDEDFLYRDEWKTYQDQLGDSLKIITTFSREGPRKVYVQHLLKENAEMVSELLKQKANFYVCGDAANMAREVNLVLCNIVSEQWGMSPERSEEMVKHMRSSGSYLADVWS
ncbi:hypothetical protein BJY01DRAFT_258674 [Aspergillus pseudoustus]|uniref:NADPH--cytochrome P450 reductase n=1 Tax=Aspergillus pseudoustus TaxID=1810923 RepID=A0ABR4J8M7_9EURO